ncbi:alkaline serine protease Alp1, partial [Colletotrichum asianum]
MSLRLGDAIVILIRLHSTITSGAAAAVVHQQIGRSLGVSNDIGDRQLQDPVRYRVRGSKARLQASEVAHQPRNERRRHAGARLRGRAGVR